MPINHQHSPTKGANEGEEGKSGNGGGILDKDEIRRGEGPKKRFEKLENLEGELGRGIKKKGKGVSGDIGRRDKVVGDVGMVVNFGTRRGSFIGDDTDTGIGEVG